MKTFIESHILIQGLNKAHLKIASMQTMTLKMKTIMGRLN